MSYNISTFKLKELNNLLIPLKAFYKSARRGGNPESRKNDDGSITLSGCEGEGITGIMHGSYVMEDIFLKVTAIDIHGEGSGYFMREILEPALKESRGKLTASCVWEGGDSINKLIVEDGKVIWENIEI